MIEPSAGKQQVEVSPAKLEKAVENSNKTIRSVANHFVDKINGSQYAWDVSTHSAEVKILCTDKNLETEDNEL